MRIGFIGLALMLMALPATAQTDFRCVSDCQAQGHPWSVCQDNCQERSQDNDSWMGNSQGTLPNNRRRSRNTDYQCMNDCISRGYQFGFCSSRCSY
jgi:hypothetical protein